MCLLLADLLCPIATSEFDGWFDATALIVWVVMDFDVSVAASWLNWQI